MSPIRTVHVPRFGSQLGSGQRGELQADRTESPSQWRGEKRGGVKVRGGKTRHLLKVKFPKLHSRTLSKKVTREEETPRTLLPAANKAKTTGSREEETPSVGTDTVGEVYKPVNEKEKAKLAVLRTTSKMLKENYLIRQRRAALED